MFDNDGPAAEDTSDPARIVVAPVPVAKLPFVPTLVAFFPPTPVAVATSPSGSPGGDAVPAGSTAHIRNRSSYVPRSFFCTEKKPEVVLSADTSGIASHLPAAPCH